MRLLLETYALPLSFAAGDLEWESRVVAAHHKLAFMERRMVAGDQAETELWKRYDREFHQSLIEACGSQTLLDLYGGVFDQYLRYQMVAVVFRGQIAAEEHKSSAGLRPRARCATSLRGAHAACGWMRELFAGERSAAMSDDVAVPTVGESAYQRIRADIVFGRLSPGKKLKLEQLKADYGSKRQHASRNPEPPSLRAARRRRRSERLRCFAGFDHQPEGDRGPPATPRMPSARTIVPGRRHGMGRAGRRRPSPAGPDGRAHGAGRHGRIPRNGSDMIGSSIRRSSPPADRRC